MVILRPEFLYNYYMQLMQTMSIKWMNLFCNDLHCAHKIVLIKKLFNYFAAFLKRAFLKQPESC